MLPFFYKSLINYFIYSYTVAKQKSADKPQGNYYSPFYLVIFGRPNLDIQKCF